MLAKFHENKNDTLFKTMVALWVVSILILLAINPAKAFDDNYTTFDAALTAAKKTRG